MVWVFRALALLSYTLDYQRLDMRFRKRSESVSIILLFCLHSPCCRLFVFVGEALVDLYFPPAIYWSSRDDLWRSTETRLYYLMLNHYQWEG